MKRDFSHFKPDDALSSSRRNPIKETRKFMNISGITSTSPIAYPSSVSRPQAQPAGDQVSMSLSADTFSNLVSTAGQMPDVRSEVVDAYKSRIQSGEYPTQETLDGLVSTMGPSWLAQANAD
jgi:hypothetical protein